MLKSAAEIAVMRRAGQVVAETLAAVAAAARPGVRLIELDALAAEVIAAAGAKPSFLGYHPTWAPIPFPGVLCLSLNDRVVHGIPDQRQLHDGDLLSVDCGAQIEGYHGDAAITVSIGTADPAARRLIGSAERALAAGIAAAQPGARIGDIAYAIGTVARETGYGVPDGLGGHGIGTALHEDPSVPNDGPAGRGARLEVGLVVAIEPILIESGDKRCRSLPDGWTVATTDGSRAAHVEHTVAITADGPVVLTTAIR